MPWARHLSSFGAVNTAMHPCDAGPVVLAGPHKVAQHVGGNHMGANGRRNVGIPLWGPGLVAPGIFDAELAGGRAGDEVRVVARIVPDLVSAAFSRFRRDDGRNGPGSIIDDDRVRARSA